MSDGSEAPGFVVRGRPGDGHAAMAALAGEFHCEMRLYIALGTAEDPAVLAVRTRREWIGDGRFLRDETVGEDYYRSGTLGYSNMDERYEWVTQDAINAGMMIYQGAPGSGPAFPADLSGVFTDQGVMGDAAVGGAVAMRTVITIADEDHHTFEIYMTAPGAAEVLADRKTYVRRG